jgi:hypothetical protein
MEGRKMSEDLINKEEDKVIAKEHAAFVKALEENPAVKDWIVKKELALRESQGYIDQLYLELNKVITLFATAVRVNGGCKMTKEDIASTYEATKEGRNHLAIVGAPGGDVRVLWKVGKPPAEPVQPLVKKAQDLTDPED